MTTLLYLIAAAVGVAAGVVVTLLVVHDRVTWCRQVERRLDEDDARTHTASLSGRLAVLENFDPPQRTPVTGWVGVFAAHGAFRDRPRHGPPPPLRTWPDTEVAGEVSGDAADQAVPDGDRADDANPPGSSVANPIAVIDVQRALASGGG